VPCPEVASRTSLRPGLADRGRERGGGAGEQVLFYCFLPGIYTPVCHVTYDFVCYC